MALTYEQCLALYGPAPMHDQGFYHQSFQHYEDVLACEEIKRAFFAARGKG